MDPSTLGRFGYEGKSVVVAGGGGTGMGAAAVKILLELGASVSVLDLQEPPSGARFIRTDLSDPESIDKAVSSLGPRVDSLFHCHGISGVATGTLPETVVAVNFLSIRYLTELLLPRMGPGSAVVSISSAGGLGWQRRANEILSLLETADMAAGIAWCREQGKDLLPQAFPHAYAFSKQALILWTMVRAEETIKNGVRLNVTSPGSTATTMAADFPDEGIEQMNQPIGRSSVPEEQAWPLVFLNSPLASYINGVNLPVDGGNHAARTVAKLTKVPA